jgi:hypothetical protein
MAWKADHKKYYCRKQQEMMKGDTMELVKPEWNNQLVEILGHDPHAERRWKIKLLIFWRTANRFIIGS